MENNYGRKIDDPEIHLFILESLVNETLTSSGRGKDVCALCDFIDRYPILEDDLGINKKLDELYVLAHRIIASRLGIDPPEFIRSYEELLMEQIRRNEIPLLTPKELVWEKLFAERNTPLE